MTSPFICMDGREIQIYLITLSKEKVMLTKQKLSLNLKSRKFWLEEFK